MSLFRKRPKPRRAESAAPGHQAQPGHRAESAAPGHQAQPPYRGVATNTGAPEVGAGGSQTGGEVSPGQGVSPAGEAPKKRSRRASRRARKPRRSWGSRLGEFAIWTAVAIGTALILISMSETLLPTNF